MFLLKKSRLLSKVYFQATSDEEKDQIKNILNAKEDRILLLNNIPTLPKKEYTKKEKLKGELKCVFLSRIHPKKNLLYAVELLKEIKGKLTYDIYGYIEDFQYWNEIQKEIKLLPSNITVNYCGIVQREEIFNPLYGYDVFLLPTLGENYGQAIVESILSSCPIIISDETTW